MKSDTGLIETYNTLIKIEDGEIDKTKPLSLTVLAYDPHDEY